MTVFNLLRESWLPVLRADGSRVFIRLSEVGTPNVVRIDTGRGDCDIALTELLIGLLAISLDPHATGNSWINGWRNPLSESELSAALAPFATAFNIDGPGPRFFQDIEELQGATMPVEALLIDAPAEHFVKPGVVRVLSRRGAALVIATLQTCAPAGGAGHRTSMRGGGPLTTLVVPGARSGRTPTLWQRLWANVPEGLGIAPADIGAVVPWVGPTRVSDRASATITTTTLDVHKAQAFFGMPRRIRLRFEPNTMRLACDLTGDIDDVILREYVTRPWGTNYIGWGKDHPLSPSYKPRPAATEFLPVHLKSSRVGFRQWLGFVFKPHPEHADEENSQLPAAAISTFFNSRADELFDDDPVAVRNARLLVAGYVLDNMKPLEFGESLLPLMAIETKTVRTAVAHLAHAWVESAQLGAKTVGVAVRGGLFDDHPKIAYGATVLENAKAQFWGETEQAYFTRLWALTEALSKAVADGSDIAAEKQNAGASWLDAMRRVALRIFDETVPIDTADLMAIDDYKRIVRARRYLVATFAGQTGDGRKLHMLLGQPDQPKPNKAANKMAPAA